MLLEIWVIYSLTLITLHLNRLCLHIYARQNRRSPSQDLCNIHLISAALPLLFPTAISLEESLSTPHTMKHKQDFTLSLCPHQHPGSVLKRSLWRYTHISDESCQNGCFLDKQRLHAGQPSNAGPVCIGAASAVELLYQCFIVKHILYAMTQSTVLSMCCLIWMSRGFLHMDQPEAVRLNKADLKTVPKGNLKEKKKISSTCRHTVNDYEVECK